MGNTNSEICGNSMIPGPVSIKKSVGYRNKAMLIARPSEKSSYLGVQWSDQEKARPQYAHQLNSCLLMVNNCMTLSSFGNPDLVVRVLTSQDHLPG